MVVKVQISMRAIVQPVDMTAENKCCDECSCSVTDDNCDYRNRLINVTYYVREGTLAKVDIYY